MIYTNNIKSAFVELGIELKAKDISLRWQPRAVKSFPDFREGASYNRRQDMEDPGPCVE